MPAAAVIPAHRPPSPTGRPGSSPTIAETSTYPAESAPSSPTSDIVGGRHPTSDLLSAIASGQQSLTAIAAAHNIPFPQFTLWLLEPETQEQLAALSAAVASATRLAATSALPEVVSSLKRTLIEVSTPEPPQSNAPFPTEAGDHPDPLRGQLYRLRRQRIALSASWLFLRLARFTPVNTTSPPRPQSTSSKSGVCSGAACSPDPDGGAVEQAKRRETEGANSVRMFALESLPRLSDFDHPDDSPSPTSPRGEAPNGGAQRAVRAPVFSTGSSSHPLSSPATSDFRHPTSDIPSRPPLTPSPSPPPEPSTQDPAEPADFEEAIRCLQHACDLTDEQVAQLRADPETWIREHLPEFVDEPALASAHAAGDG